jgi:hypothetical protein
MTPRMSILVDITKCQVKLTLKMDSAEDSVRSIPQTTDWI